MHKKAISMLALGLLLGGGIIGAYQTMAQNNNATKTPTTLQQEIQTPLYQGSVTVSDARYQGKSEQDESKALAGLAKITAQQAKQAAENKVRGTASSVELGNENGTLVYEVKIGKQEVKVDAGNGSILKVEQADNEKEGVENEAKKDGVDRDNINHQTESQGGHED